MDRGEDTVLRSRLGEPLCTGLPWLPPETYEAPRGMLQRPSGCVFAHDCAEDRCCWQAKQFELAADRSHRERFRHGQRVARELRAEDPIITFEEHAGLVERDEVKAA